MPTTLDDGWYVRITAEDPDPFPCLTYQQGDTQARWLSKKKDGPKRAQLVRVEQGKLWVVFAYLNGKKFAGGRKAQYMSDQGLYPFG